LNRNKMQWWRRSKASWVTSTLDGEGQVKNTSAATIGCLDWSGSITIKGAQRDIDRKNKNGSKERNGGRVGVVSLLMVFLKKLMGPEGRRGGVGEEFLSGRVSSIV